MNIVERKRPLNDLIVKYSKGTVLSGPFKGMHIIDEQCWDDGNYGTKLLGCYEQELHPVIERQIARLVFMDRPQIVNLGCAEGYYAVGMARRIPNAIVYAIDISDDAKRITQLNAQQNDVTVITDAYLDESLFGPDLIISDCEGSEIEYLDPQRFPAVTRANMIVEVHDFKHRSATDILTERFRDTHKIEAWFEAARNPNQFVFLQPLHSLDRWAAISEGRPCMMHWLIMTPR